MQLRLRLFSTLLFLLYAGISADAAPRTASEAKRLAQQYFTSQAISLRNTPQKAASLTLSLESAPKMSSALLRATGAQTADACYYFVYNRGEGEGFVIVSGDDRLAPYIGFPIQDASPLRTCPIIWQPFWNSAASPLMLC